MPESTCTSSQYRMASFRAVSKVRRTRPCTSILIASADSAQLVDVRYRPCNSHRPIPNIASHRNDAALVCTKRSVRLQTVRLQTDAMRCGAYGRMRCIWSDAVLVITKRSVRLQTDAMRCIWSDAVHMVGCGAYGPMPDAVHMVRCGSCYYKKVSTITNRCDAYGRMQCDAYGPMRFLLLQKDQFDYKPMRCGAYGPMRCI